MSKSRPENREAFFARLRPILSPGELLDVELAYALAKHAHRAQVRSERGADDKPLRYFEHPRRVALVLIDEVRVSDPELICVALLHDGVEDTRELTPAMIERHWGPDVARLVQLLSKVPKEGYIERLATYGDWRARLVKAADRLDNLRSLGEHQVTAAFRERQLTETRRLYLPLLERLTAEVPDALRPGTERLMTELRERVNG